MFPGFNNSKKRGTISRGDFDRDGVSNRKDCEPLNFKKQGAGHKKIKGDLIDTKNDGWDLDGYRWGARHPKYGVLSANSKKEAMEIKKMMEDDTIDMVPEENWEEHL